MHELEQGGAWMAQPVRICKGNLQHTRIIYLLWLIIQPVHWLLSLRVFNVPRCILIPVSRLLCFGVSNPAQWKRSHTIMTTMHTLPVCEQKAGRHDVRSGKAPLNLHMEQA